mmetsp:Transcript_29854/g.59369  ORF Transcript_29854/g.59369 Transcript_29854/m.59369 type:complete len:314 (-) Transcript_29854:181-1122(-)|eukprot:CAMPEP_0182462362 /NCGR_PEP_ID=MMETSP1319-20130603/6652_1 /TAXON_ID=172717 /ORGANISM="Bolidomonas pacifica, Strain RCC208" /LENGTH=313 /DNA_ID=CAMNT_0024661785 /DNA_START=264 /DNA_END=1205 /DNA_ORIENTATION=+
MPTVKVHPGGILKGSRCRIFAVVTVTLALLAGATMAIVLGLTADDDATERGETGLVTTGREATLLSAFFGLDDGLPSTSNQGICSGAAGKDGMPVIFSHEIDVNTLQAGDFRVVSASGAVGLMTCVTPDPADDIGELRTILLVGQFGSAEDQPATVEIVDNILSIDGQLNFKGASVAVTPLEAGPEMVWAEVIPESQWELGKEATLRPFGGGDGCPVGTVQVVRVTWAGGVTKPGGSEIDELERVAYNVTLSDPDQGEQEVVPFAIGDLGDGDNNHELCLDQTGVPLRVSFPAGLLTDPGEDLNPASSIDVTH